MAVFGTLVRRALSRNPRAYATARRLMALVRFAVRRPHDRDYAAFAEFRDRDGLFLDVGANVGQSALSFRIFHPAPILSVEPNPEHEADLRLLRHVLRRFDFLMVAAGEENGTATLHVPTYRGVAITGEGSLLGTGDLGAYWSQQHLSERAGTMGLLRREVPVRRLDELELEPAFIKLDTEGFEIHALRGLSETLRRHRPVVLVERSECFEEVSELLTSLGYAAHRFDPSTRLFFPLGDERSVNVFFLPGA